MKGIVFRELINMAESKFGLETVDKVLKVSNIKGAYTSVGTYNYKELLTIVIGLSNKLGIPIGKLVRAFGVHMHHVFVKKYGQFYAQNATVFDFLMALENHVHVEVKKLYPDAELPTFEHYLENSTTLVMIYRSKRPFADLAEGLIQAVIEHYGEKISLTAEDLEGDPGTARLFRLERK